MTVDIEDYSEIYILSTHHGVYQLDCLLKREYFSNRFH